MKLIFRSSVTWKLFSGLLMASSLVACSSGNLELITQMSDKAVADVSCGNIQNLMMDDMKRYLISEKKLPNLQDLKQKIHQSVEVQLKNLETVKKNEIEMLLIDWAQLVVEELPKVSNSKQMLDILTQISALDVGDQSDPVRKNLNQEKLKRIQTLSQKISAADLECPSANPGEGPSEGPISSAEMNQRARIKNLSLPAFGARWVMATAYQSCQALQINPLQKSDAPVKGISIVGQHSDGVGSKRIIQSLDQVQKTHYYLNPSEPKTCFDVYSQPLIYDYGGKPFTDGTVGSDLNLHKNAGDGTKVLGIDCSGFVYSSFAASGLRLQKNRTLKATDVYAWGSGSYVDPENNGLSCLQKISITENESIRSGDIVAIQGHVLMIDEVESDPFGIDAVKERAQCESVKASGFHFSIIQSSNSKNGVGINRYQASDYFLPGEHMTRGIERYAIAACYAKFDKKTTIVKSSELAIVRHSLTEECRDQRVDLTDESCIQSCPQL